MVALYRLCMRNTTTVTFTDTKRLTDSVVTKAVPGITARYREELGNPARRPCIVCAPGPAANEG